jgi:hypothetical protein
MEIPIDHKPTAADMRKLAPRQYYTWDGHVYLKAYRVKYQAHFVCPFCYTKYRKDGQPYANAKPTVHYHGICGFNKDGFGDRCTHCQRLPAHVGTSGYKIFCDDSLP